VSPDQELFGSSCPPRGWAWQLDPTALALDASAWRDKKERSWDQKEGSWDPPFCAELGRRILLAELEFSEWVLRRVEKVEFERDRSVTRRVSMEFRIRDDAPVFVDGDGQGFWLVPLSMMRRRTLVNLEIQDEHGEPVTIPGIRLSQQLDQSILLAAAATSTSLSSDPRRSVLYEFIGAVITGKHNKVVATMKAFESNDPAVPEILRTLAVDRLFTTVLQRLRRNFSLYVFLPVTSGRHRLLQMSFDEPTEWSYQLPQLGRNMAVGCITYRPGKRVGRYEKSHLAAAFGLIPTRVRFQVPAAENAASYHFEVSAPQGTRICRASLLAGRPNEPDRHVSADSIVGHSPTMGLHAVEIPNGSLCRTQLDLRVPTRGWLTTMVTSCWLIFFVLLSLLLYSLLQSAPLTADQLSNLVLLLVTTSAGVVALIAQRDFGGVAARLVTPMRALGATSTALPIVTAGLLTYASRARELLPNSVKFAVGAVSFASLVIVVFTTFVWIRTRKDERRSIEELSPWDQTEDGERRNFTNFWDALESYQFDTAAIGVRSAEGWHERYSWTDEHQEDAVAALQPRANEVWATQPKAEEAGLKPGVLRCNDLGTACARTTQCPAADGRRSAVTRI
jgi:hypothetical protein